jgi:hypothetical protein
MDTDGVFSLTRRPWRGLLGKGAYLINNKGKVSYTGHSTWRRSRACSSSGSCWAPDPWTSPSLGGISALLAFYSFSVFLSVFTYLSPSMSIWKTNGISIYRFAAGGGRAAAAWLTRIRIRTPPPIWHPRPSTFVLAHTSSVDSSETTMNLPPSPKTLYEKSPGGHRRRRRRRPLIIPAPIYPCILYYTTNP